MKFSKDKPSGREPSPDDRELFRRIVTGAKPLASDVVPPPRRKPPARARFTRSDEWQVLRESLATAPERIEADNGDGLGYRHPSIGRKTMRRLSRGGFSVQSEIDLHGMTITEARAALAAFLAECRLRGLTCVRIVHGKGRRSGERGPVLKRKVDVWLRQWDGVLAFVSA
ncbi:MAG TPA: Smr/MutS family protein, partial [Woeseiaceae bacterium]|nr:Smr/MutS family protein [Woeseiaceae bacterium]